MRARRPGSGPPRQYARVDAEDQLLPGYFVSLTFGQQRWIKTLGIGHGEVTVATVADPNAARAGLAPEKAPK